ncbi:MAG: DNA replication/repair protein RecF [Pyrinomonadaceae bacterium]
MILRSVEVHGFRNLAGKNVWGEGLNILYGSNGQGKTNWLEAIYLLAHTKSFRTAKLQEAIQFGEAAAYIRGEVAQNDNLSRELQVSLQGKNKIISVNGKRETVSRYAGQLHTVAFTADELDVVRGVPDARRKFLDRGVVSLRPAYVQTLADYNRVIRQKNRLLQDALDGRLRPDEAVESLKPWNDQLVELSSQIHRSRSDYVNRLNEALDHTLFQDDVTIRYRSSLEGKGDLADYQSLMAERLQFRLAAEMAAGTSLIGPHRDDLEILFDNRDLRTFGSSGQQRSALITLDLAAISVYYSWHKDYPIFLIDDVDAELDGKRINYLLEYLDGRTQTFVTTSKESHLQQFLPRANAYLIEGGCVKTTRWKNEAEIPSARAMRGILS